MLKVLQEVLVNNWVTFTCKLMGIFSIFTLQTPLMERTTFVNQGILVLTLP
jgi:hypothetical protein